MANQVNLYEAKSHLSQLVDRAAEGEEIVIAKAGKPMARLVSLEKKKARRSRAFGRNLLKVTQMTPDFYADLPIEFFVGEQEEAGK